jgi:hypothetical protein
VRTDAAILLVENVELLDPGDVGVLTRLLVELECFPPHHAGLFVLADSDMGVPRLSLWVVGSDRWAAASSAARHTANRS